MKNKNKKTADDIKDKKILNNFRKDRESMKGSGALYEMFFHDADPRFTEGIEKLVLKYSKFAKLAAEQINASARDKSMMAELEKMISNPPSKPRKKYDGEEEDA